MELISSVSSATRYAVIHNIRSDINQIRSYAEEIKIKIAGSHFKSAKQSLEAYETNSEKSELFSSIGHLRDVYNILCDALSEKRSKFTWILILPLPSEDFVIDNREKRFNLYTRCFFLAKIISEIYRHVDDEESCDRWRSMSRSMFDKILDEISNDYRFKHTTTESNIEEVISGSRPIGLRPLYRISDNYVDTFRDSESLSQYSSHTNYRVDLTEDGKNYLNSIREIL